MADVGAKLLVVEDDDRVRAALRLALEDEGYEVAEARARRARCSRCAPAACRT
jgi:DNA-binding response OmpR family regulator